jgi:hypothetical protein
LLVVHVVALGSPIELIKRKMAALVEEFCLQHVGEASLDFLVALTEEYQKQLSADKRDDKQYVLKVVLRHLTSEAVENSADHGAALFLKLYQELGVELKKVGVKLKEEEDPLLLEEDGEEEEKNKSTMSGPTEREVSKW